MDTMQLVEMAKAVNGRARSRTIGQKEAQTILDLVAAHQNSPELHTIRVYSSDGFVANSYNFRADVRYFEATRNEQGEFVVRTGSCDAHRSGGSGALITVNWRAA
jgi:hypothetical protein